MTLSPEDQKRYLDDVTAALKPVLAANPQVKADYDALMAAAQKYRQ